MTVAWYGHLKHKDKALWLVILASWGIAFFEYCLQVPANRIGSGYFTVTQLKVMQEVITLSVFKGNVQMEPPGRLFMLGGGCIFYLQKMVG